MKRFWVRDDIFDQDLKAYEKLVYMYLCRIARGNTCIASYQTIASKCGISKSTVGRSLRALRERGLIKTKTRNNGRTNDIVITLPGETHTEHGAKVSQSLTETPTELLLEYNSLSSNTYSITTNPKEDGSIRTPSLTTNSGFPQKNGETLPIYTILPEKVREKIKVLISPIEGKFRPEKEEKFEVWFQIYKEVRPYLKEKVFPHLGKIPAVILECEKLTSFLEETGGLTIYSEKKWRDFIFSFLKEDFTSARKHLNKLYSFLRRDIENEDPAPSKKLLQLIGVLPPEEEMNSMASPKPNDSYL